MRVFSDADLKSCSRQNLERKLDMVKASNELTREEQKQNIAKLEFYLNGQVHFTKKEVTDDIAAGSADIDDIIGKNLHIK